MEAFDDDSMMFLLIIAPFLVFLILKNCGKKKPSEENQQQKACVRQTSYDVAQVVVAPVPQHSAVYHRKGLREKPVESSEIANEISSSDVIELPKENYDECITSIQEDDVLEQKHSSVYQHDHIQPEHEEGDSFNEVRCKSVQEFLGRSDGVFKRLIREGFSTRAAIRSLLQHERISSRSCDLSLPVCFNTPFSGQNASKIDINAPLRDEEIYLIGNENLLRFSEIERNLLSEHSEDHKYNLSGSIERFEGEIESKGGQEMALPLEMNEGESLQVQQETFSSASCSEDESSACNEQNSDYSGLQRLKLEVLDKTGYCVSGASNFVDVCADLSILDRCRVFGRSAQSVHRKDAR
eukprot:752634-Hanusia_phi.AAC.1